MTSKWTLPTSCFPPPVRFARLHYHAQNTRALSFNHTKTPRGAWPCCRGSWWSGWCCEMSQVPPHHQKIRSLLQLQSKGWNEATAPFLHGFYCPAFLHVALCPCPSAQRSVTWQWGSPASPAFRRAQLGSGVGVAVTVRMSCCSILYHSVQMLDFLGLALISS